jgi:hypothetical protein
MPYELEQALFSPALSFPVFSGAGDKKITAAKNSVTNTPTVSETVSESSRELEKILAG